MLIETSVTTLREMSLIVMAIAAGHTFDVKAVAVGKRGTNTVTFVFRSRFCRSHNHSDFLA